MAEPKLTIDKGDHAEVHLVAECGCDACGEERRRLKTRTLPIEAAHLLGFINRRPAGSLARELMQSGVR